MEKQSSSSNITEEASPTPSFSSCSSEFEFEFTISLSPNNNNNNKNKNHHFCPADELFYKGKLLPLHHSPRITMLRTLLLSSDSSTTTTTAGGGDDSRDSSASSSSADLQFFSFSDFDSSRPSSVSEDDKFINFNHNLKHPSDNFAHQIKKNKFLSFSIFPSVFCTTTKREKYGKKLLGFSARDVIRRYFKKLKPLYEKIGTFSVISTEYAVFGVPIRTEEYEKNQNEKKLFTLRKNGAFSDSFTAKLRCVKAGKCGSSCPSSIESSPNRSCKDSSVEEIQSDIQSAIAHCKNSMLVSIDDNSNSNSNSNSSSSSNSC